MRAAMAETATRNGTLPDGPAAEPAPAPPAEPEPAPPAEPEPAATAPEPGREPWLKPDPFDDDTDWRAEPEPAPAAPTWPPDDPLPEAVRAALALRVGAAPGLDVDTIARRVTWSMWAASLTARYGAAEQNWTAQTARDLLLRHPDLAGLGILVVGMRTGHLWENPPDRTELGLAERIAATCGADLAFNTVGAWHVWDDTRWRADTTGAAATEPVKGVVRGLIAAEAAEAERIAGNALAMLTKAGKDPAKLKGGKGGKGGAGGADLNEADAECLKRIEAAKQAAIYAKATQGARVIMHGLELARGEPGLLVPADQWDARRDLLNLANGTVELRADGAVLREHRRADRITRVSRGAYRPGAERDPVWRKFLRESFPDKAVRTRFQRVLGAALYGGNLERLLVILLGQGSTGKSTLFEAIAHALGEHAAPIELSTLRSTREGGQHRGDLVAVMSRRIVFTTEASPHWKLSADMIKRITGGDSMSPRGVHAKTHTEGPPSFVPFIATNEAPTILGADPALWRRLEAIPVDTAVACEDVGLPARLRECADAIITWAVLGWVDYARHGLGERPAACEVATARVRRDISLIDMWLAERAAVDDPDAVERPLHIADSWQGWCVARRVAEVDRLSDVALARALEVRGYRLGLAGPKEKRFRVRRGLRLLRLNDEGEGTDAAEDTAVAEEGEGA